MGRPFYAAAYLESKLKDMQEEIDTLADLIEEGGSNEAPGWWTKTSVGGYGELHWENAGTPNDSNSSNNNVDAHRYVLFFGHEFNKYLNFNSEFELEHGLVKDDHGELELEQMYLEQKQRTESQNSISDISEFLKKLNLEIEIKKYFHKIWCCFNSSRYY